MTRALLKKQMMEVFAWLYEDKKSGKIRGKNQIIGYGLLYLLLFGFLGVIFYMLADGMCEPFLSIGMGWLYWCIMGLVAVFLGVFGSVFNTYASLYQAKDNDLLLSMPIPASRILLVRLSGVYVMGLMYELLVMIPTVIVWFIKAPFSLAGAVCVVLIPFVLSLFILVLSAVLGWVVALITSRLKNKNLITVFISLIFIVAYYYFYSRAYAMLQNLLQQAEMIGDKIKNILFPFYHMGLAAEGNLLSMLIFSGIMIALLAVTYLVLAKSFIRLVTANRGSAKAVYKEQRAKCQTVEMALLKKELSRFYTSSTYMLNCGLGIVFMIVAAVVLVWKRDMISTFTDMGLSQELLTMIGIAGIGYIAAMNDISAPSISLEGKNIWLTQVLPVTGRQVLMSKFKLHLLLTVIPAVPLVIVALCLLSPSWPFYVLMPMTLLLFIVVMDALGLCLNLKMPNLKWTNEMVPIKQSMPVMLTLFGGWVLIAILAVIYWLLSSVLSASLYLVLVCLVLGGAAFVLLRYLRHTGAEIFENL